MDHSQKKRTKENFKACFQHDMAHEGFKELTRKAASDKILGDKTFNVAKNPKYCESKRGHASLVYNVLIKTSGSGIENENMSNQNQLSQNLKKGNYTQLL